MLPPARRISALEARRLAPALAEEGLRGALLSWDGQLEDDARLVVAVARTAAAHGARILTYAGVTGLREDGVDAVDGLTGARVHGAGAARDRRRRRVERASWRRRSRCGRAAARTCWSRPGGSATRAPPSTSRSATARWVFALPRSDGLVAIGLTDVPAEGPIPDEPLPSADEEAQLLAHASAALAVDARPRATSPAATPACARCWTTARATRPPTSRAATRCSRDPATGALTLVGGQAHDLPADGAGRRRPDHRPPVPHGAAPAGGRARRAAAAGAAPAAPPGAPARLARRYGAEAADVAQSGSLEPVAPGVPVCEAELRWAVDHELALTPSRTSSTAAPAPVSCRSGARARSLRRRIGRLRRRSRIPSRSAGSRASGVRRGAFARSP